MPKAPEQTKAKTTEQAHPAKESPTLAQGMQQAVDALDASVTKGHHFVYTILDKNGKPVTRDGASQTGVFDGKSMEELQAFLAESKDSYAIGEGERFAFAEVKDGKIVQNPDGSGLMVLAQKVPGEQGKEEFFTALQATEKEAKAGLEQQKTEEDRRNYLERMMENAVESGNMMMMFMAALMMYVADGQNEHGKTQQQEQEQQPKQAASSGKHLEVTDYSAEAGHEEMLSIHGAMSPEEIGTALRVSPENMPKFLEQLNAITGGEAKQLENVSLRMDIDPFVDLPSQQVPTAPSGQTRNSSGRG